MTLPRGLYGMVDPTFGDPLAQGRLLAEEGVEVAQLRCKGWTTAERVALAAALRPTGLLLVVNDDVEAARLAGAWVHLGQGDGPDPDMPFGRSCHTPAQILAAGAARYVGFGPIFATATKDTGRAPRGLDGLAAAVAVSPVPVVAIGGIGVAEVAGVRAAGAWAWAVVGGVWRAPDPRVAIRALRG